MAAPDLKRRALPYFFVRQTLSPLTGSLWFTHNKTDETVQVVRSGAESAAATVLEMQKGKSQVDVTAEKVAAVGSRSQKIGEMPLKYRYDGSGFEALAG